MAERQKQQRWLTEFMTRVAMYSGVGYVAAAYSVSRWLTRPTRQRVHFVSEQAGLTCEPLHCGTADRVRLVGWAITPPQPRGNVVLFHGMRHHREKLLGRMARLTAAGYRCIAFDHRAHGESKGRRTSFGFYESRDVVAVLDLAQQRWPGEPTAALGISMGAAALCFAATAARRLQAVIMESVYHDVASAFRSRIGNHYPEWFNRLSPGVIWVTERRLGVRITEICPAEHIAGLAPVPLLLMTGMNDLHASPMETRRMHQRYPGPCELWIVPDAGHRDLFETAGPTYGERVLGFLERNLRAKRLSTSA